MNKAQMNSGFVNSHQGYFVDDKGKKHYSIHPNTKSRLEKRAKNAATRTERDQKYFARADRDRGFTIAAKNARRG